MRVGICKFFIWALLISCLVFPSLEFDPEDNYLINCGSSVNTPLDHRVFLADVSNFSSFLSTPQNISAVANSDSIPSATYGLALYQTARIFNGSSQYNFSIKKQGRHWIRLHLFPFLNPSFNLSTAKFSVSAQNFTLLKDFQPSSAPTVKEYLLNITTKTLVLNFIPAANSIAFLNAFEVTSIPDELIPADVATIGSSGQHQNLETRALETVVRVNMGNEAVLPKNDSLGRLWLSDSGYLTSNHNLVLFLSNVGLVNFTTAGMSENIGPSLVYGTGTELYTALEDRNILNATWQFQVDPGFDYFIRFHFCNILNASDPNRNNLFFTMYLNSEFAAKDVNLSTVGVPQYIDVVTSVNSIGQLNVSLGSSNAFNSFPDGILNGLEVIKISDSGGSLAAADARVQEKSSATSSKSKVWVFVGSAVGVSIFIMVVVLVFALFCRRRRRAIVVHTTLEQFAANGASFVVNKSPAADSSLISESKRGYRFPFVVVREATDNFSESLIIGVGGFGKVYKGVLSDGTKVAVKRGVSESRQGLSEFKTEIEMLSQVRHRHLVSLIGYCDERNEMIIIYEFMENGTLKDHLYGSDHPKLNWRQRLEICIGSARGLHYLHTGSVKAIIHRDVKSANILLDENLLAKVADFGISKSGPELDQTHVSTVVKGSFGYLDPEYLTTQQLTDKSDVYSFGVVMIEILCGRPVIDPSQPRERVNLVEWAIQCLNRGELEIIVDPHIASEVKPDSLMKFKETVEKCLADLGANRPTMGDVLWNLESAFQLQVGDPRDKNQEQTNSQKLDVSISSTGQFSLGSFGDLEGVSMRRVFSNMIKAENAIDQHQQDAI
ncbi:OLC1v1026578C1 [Oldenlandia corymbosa var. corymbosa]|uniref:OLC1v1026578C1 n=1 Tax=Oldenlandia corymbosa var. corymbosa TaxID=529605 RepID=A0AAV1C7Y9_OLDCO|nr:OLC1v1026578C1 [Oldenlandia corymbosa var. corymbosa]